MSTLATRLTHPTRVIVFIVHIVTIITMIRILHAVHTIITRSAVIISSKAGAATSATPGAFVVSGQSIAARKASTTFVANMWSLACMQFGVAFEIMQPSEA
jgi:hypothetical protein